PLYPTVFPYTTPFRSARTAPGYAEDKSGSRIGWSEFSGTSGLPGAVVFSGVPARELVVRVGDPGSVSSFSRWNCRLGNWASPVQPEHAALGGPGCRRYSRDFLYTGRRSTGTHTARHCGFARRLVLVARELAHRGHAPRTSVGRCRQAGRAVAARCRLWGGSAAARPRDLRRKRAGLP